MSGVETDPTGARGVEARMRALVYRRFGPPDVLETAEMDSPVATEGRVVVRVRAVALNPYDLHFLRGDPYVMRPMMKRGVRRLSQPSIPGSDVAGVVESVGPGVTRFATGDEVVGTVGLGGLAEYVAASENALAAKPAALSFEEAAAIPMAATTAIQALRDVGRVGAGMKVLVNGAAGGIGTFAVPLARTLGAVEVTGVCSNRNLELVRSIGADRAIDYEAEDFTRGGRRFDVVVDTVGNHSARAMCRAVVDGGAVVLLGGGRGRMIGPLGQLAGAKLVSPFVHQRIALVMAHTSADDVAFVCGLAAAGTLRVVVDRTYRFDEAREAFRCLETRHVRGKVVIAL